MADFGSAVSSTTVDFEAFFTTSEFGSKPFGVAIAISVCVLPQPRINELHTLFPSPKFFSLFWVRCVD